MMLGQGGFFGFVIDAVLLAPVTFFALFIDPLGLIGLPSPASLVFKTTGNLFGFYFVSLLMWITPYMLLKVIWCHLRPLPYEKT